MSLSYWEIQTWLTNVDFTVVGSGIVGLSCALQLRKQHPKAKIVVLEKGMFPQGASTKNAGFACFGSATEILDDLKTHSEAEVVSLVKKRVEGLQLLRETLEDKTISYKEYGGYELFLNQNKDQFYYCIEKLSYINALLKPVFDESVFSVKDNSFGFKQVMPNYVFNKFEGQIDTGKMMQGLLKKAASEEVLILNNCQLIRYTEKAQVVELLTHNFKFNSQYVCIATNGFAQQLLDLEVKPARAQVLITKPITNLQIKGTFHLDKGYYYFRNINNRILFGGGRNLDFKGEETTKFGQSEQIQQKLEEILKETILPNSAFEIEHRWSGIMGVGSQKKPIVKPISNRVYCGVRLGGMGVAIGSTVGKDLASMLS